MHVQRWTHIHIFFIPISIFVKNTFRWSTNVYKLITRYIGTYMSLFHSEGLRKVSHKIMQWIVMLFSLSLLKMLLNSTSFQNPKITILAACIEHYHPIIISNVTEHRFNNEVLNQLQFLIETGSGAVYQR